MLAATPCAVLSATILALNFVGEGVAEAMDPRSAQHVAGPTIRAVAGTLRA